MPVSAYHHHILHSSGILIDNAGEEGDFTFCSRTRGSCAIADKLLPPNTRSRKAVELELLFFFPEPESVCDSEDDDEGWCWWPSYDARFGAKAV